MLRASRKILSAMGKILRDNYPDLAPEASRWIFKYFIGRQH
jgi:hypothetical protein